ncbi:MAG: hypothetical protein BWZ09_02149 [Alphaproteobacteria bacterium ADurb.BinA305]|nr:MAG: hypothetical protein BWZ09_02149 [Alphaproteobacteria bacterium ADurb.BinA305]
MVIQVRTSVAGRSASGSGRCRVSSKRSAISASVAAPNSASADKALRQPKNSASTPPSGMLRQAITPSPVSPLLIARAPISGL